MIKKTLIILLVALLLVGLLFIASLGLAGREGQQVNLSGPGQTSVSSWLSRPVAASYLTPASGNAPGCRLENEQIIIQPGQVCVFSMASDKLWTRRLRLALQQENSAGSLKVSLQQKDALKIEQTILPNRTPTPFDIYGRKDQAAATLEIRALENGTPGPTEWVIEIMGK